MSREVTWIMDYYDFVNILEERRKYIKEVYGWEIPDLVFDDYLDCYADNEISGSPASIVDNLATNGDYRDIYDFIDYNSNDTDLIKTLNKAYCREDNSFCIYDVLDRLESHYGIHRYAYDNDSINFEVIKHYFESTIDELIENINCIEYFYELDEYEDKLILTIESNDNNVLNLIDDKIVETFNYLNESNTESHHLGILSFEKLESTDESSKSYKFDIFAFPFGYAIGTY